MEIQIAIWTPDETHSSVRSWQPILMIIIMTTLMTTSSSVEPCEAASHAQRRRGSCSSGKEPGTFHARASLPSASCTIICQGAGSSRTMHAVHLSKCTPGQLLARHRTRGFVNVSRKVLTRLRRQSAMRYETAAVVQGCVVMNGFDSHKNE